jgi:hypothetical protein
MATRNKIEGDFWDFAIATFGHEAGPLGDFLRLLARRVLAYPRQPRTEAELQSILQNSRVHASDQEISAIWAGHERRE